MSRATLDEAITAEVIRSALAVAVEEASIVVVRASHSTFIRRVLTRARRCSTPTAS